MRSVNTQELGHQASPSTGHSYWTTTDIRHKTGLNITICQGEEIHLPHAARWPLMKLLMLSTHCLIGSLADNIELGHDELEIYNAGFMAAVLSQVSGGSFKRYGREQKQDQDEEKKGRDKRNRNKIQCFTFLLYSRRKSDSLNFQQKEKGKIVH